MFHLGTTEDLTIQYTDNESDLCNITSDLELQESFLAKKGEILKLEISLNKKNPQKEPEHCNQRNGNTSENISGILSWNWCLYFHCFNSSEGFSSSKIDTDIFDKIFELVHPIIENLDIKKEAFKETFTRLKSKIEFFWKETNIQIESIKNPLEPFLHDIDEWLAQIDIFTSEKSRQDQEPNSECKVPDGVYEVITKKVQQFLDTLDQWIADININAMNQTTQSEESNLERSDHPFADSLFRHLNEFYDLVINEIQDQFNTVQFEQQMQELQKMGFNNDERNFNVLTQTNGDLSSAIALLVDSEKA